MCGLSEASGFGSAEVAVWLRILGLGLSSGFQARDSGPEGGSRFKVRFNSIFG